MGKSAQRQDCPKWNQSRMVRLMKAHVLLTPVLEERLLKRSRVIFKLQRTGSRSDASGFGGSSATSCP